MKKCANRLILPVVLWLLLCPGLVCSEDTAETEALKDTAVFDLGEVVIEGKAETITSVATVETIDRKRLDLISVDNVSDAINSVPGVTMSIGKRNERNFSIRGFNERYVPVFYDGIPIYIPYDGYVDTGKLPIGNLSKITVTKGISSVLYGFNSMGGVVNIVSKKPQKSFEGDYKLGITEDNTYDANINLGAKHGDFYFTANAGYLDSDGFPLSNKFDRTINEDGDTRDNSYVERKSGSFKVGYNPGKEYEFAVGINKVDSEHALPPNATSSSARYWRFTDWEKLTYYAIGNTKITDNLKVNIRLYRDEYYNVLDSYDDDTYSTQTRGYAFHSTYDDYSNGGSVVLRSKHIKKNKLSFSFHYKKDVHEEQDDTGDAWERYEQEMFSYGLEDDFKISENLALVIGASYDIQNPKYANGETLRDDEDAFNPQAGIRLTVLDDLDLHFSAGRKTRFPTLKELYSGLLGKNTPNPNLKEEKANNYEIGMKKPVFRDSRISLALFHSDIEDKIVNKTIAASTSQYQNIGEARQRGLEFTVASGLIPKNNIELHYTFIDAENRSSDRTSEHLEKIPEHKLYITDLYRINDFISLFGKLEWNSERHFEDYDTGEWRTTSGFCTADLKAILKIKEYLKIELGVKNLFDQDYQLVDGYPREGINFFGVLRGTF
jgi:iron complex outermembrane receptor protein